MPVGFATVLKFGIFIIAIIVAILVFIRGKKTELKAISLVGVTFLIIGLNALTAVSVDFDPNVFFSSKTLYNLLALTSVIFYALFVHYAFYVGRKSPIKVVLIILAICLIVMLIFSISAFVITGSFAPQNQDLSASHINHTFSVLIMVGSNCLVSGWRFNASLDSYFEIKDNVNVEDWIKLKYKLIMLSSVFLVCLAVLQIIDYSMIKLLTVMALVFLAFVLETLIWLPPNRLKKWANRNYDVTDETAGMSEEEILAQLEED